MEGGEKTRAHEKSTATTTATKRKRQHRMEEGYQAGQQAMRNKSLYNYR
jgi:hypothetical protein